MVILYLQYVLDYHKCKLDLLDRIAHHYLAKNLTLPQAELLETFRDQLMDNYQEAWRASKAVGAPYMNLKYLLEIALIMETVFININYIWPQYYGDFEVSIVYVILAPHRLQGPVDSLIRDRINNFITSSRTYSAKNIEPNSLRRKDRGS